MSAPASRHDEARAALLEVYELLASIGRRAKTEEAAQQPPAPVAAGTTTAE